jgi:hypothetical protein
MPHWPEDSLCVMAEGAGQFVTAHVRAALHATALRFFVQFLTRLRAVGSAARTQSRRGFLFAQRRLGGVGQIRQRPFLRRLTLRRLRPCRFPVGQYAITGRAEESARRLLDARSERSQLDLLLSCLQVSATNAGRTVTASAQGRFSSALHRAVVTVHEHSLCAGNPIAGSERLGSDVYGHQVPAG